MLVRACGILNHVSNQFRLKFIIIMVTVRVLYCGDTGSINTAIVTLGTSSAR